MVWINHYNYEVLTRDKCEVKQNCHDRTPMGYPHPQPGALTPQNTYPIVFYIDQYIGLFLLCIW